PLRRSSRNFHDNFSFDRDDGILGNLSLRRKSEQQQQRRQRKEFHGLKIWCKSRLFFAFGKSLGQACGIQSAKCVELVNRSVFDEFVRKTQYPQRALVIGLMGISANRRPESARNRSIFNRKNSVVFAEDFVQRGIIQRLYKSKVIVRKRQIVECTRYPIPDKSSR